MIQIESKRQTGDVMKNVLTLPDDEMIDLVHETLRHAAQTIIDNLEGADDSRDYRDAASDLIHELTHVIAGEAGDDETSSPVRHWFNTMFLADTDSEDHPYMKFASDAVPPVWDEFIVNED
jgi:hypothetical protein